MGVMGLEEGGLEKALAFASAFSAKSTLAGG